MSSRHFTSPAHLVGVLVAALLAAGLGACGSDDDGGKDAARDNQATTAAEKAFLTAMVSHHESAIEMAKIAEKRGEDPLIKKPADDIVSAQEREIAQAEEIYSRLFDDGELKPDPGAHDGLGLTAEEAGMTHSPETSQMLRSADPFDRAFVDEMVPHHKGGSEWPTRC